MYRRRRGKSLGNIKKKLRQENKKTDNTNGGPWKQQQELAANIEREPPAMQLRRKAETYDRGLAAEQYVPSVVGLTQDSKPCDGFCKGLHG